MFAKRVFAFYASNRDKYAWLIKKFIGLWLVYAKEDQIKNFYKSVISSCISIGERGLIFNFNFLTKILLRIQSQYFHPHFCTNTLDTNVHGTFMGNDIIEYKNFEVYWERDIEHEVCTTL